MTLYSIIELVDSFCFIVLGLSAVYLFIFAIMSHRKVSYSYPQAKKANRIIVFFPAYKEDNVIEEAINSFLNQTYPKDKFDLVVISDHMEEITNQRLSKLPIKLLKVNFEQSTKAKALNYAIDSSTGTNYDLVVILDADNTVDSNFLHKINNAYHSGAMAIQAHRVAKNLNTETAILDAVSEEINNSIFRKGHVRLGFSSALIGSGMAFDFKWFKEHIKLVSSAGEDKELETMLLKENIYIEYLDDVLVYDEKTQKDSVFYNQRRRWLAAQFYSLTKSLIDLPHAVICLNVDYIDKLVQWTMPSRIMLLGFSFLFSLMLLPVNWLWSIKWLGLLLLLIITFSLAVPDYLVNDKFIKALKKAPKLFILMTLNIFRIRGASKKFIHTEHGSNSNTK